LTGADGHGRVDQFNPAMGALFAALPTWTRAKRAHSAERVASFIEKRLIQEHQRALSGGVPATVEYALRWRSGIVARCIN
jgi:hypothetical protein